MIFVDEIQLAKDISVPSKQWWDEFLSSSKKIGSFLKAKL